ncbi:radical SAM protein [Candidatus Pacearchaeota archaeon]|nr:radical SAM protein [Candidatus Pacearchaeota archaeon]
MTKNKEVVYLVNAANDAGMSAIANDYSFPAFGVLSLGTWLKQRMPELEIVVRDGGVHSHERVLEDLYTYNPLIVGVSVLGTSYQNALQIAEAAKCFGATTVFGNDQAAQLARKIIQNRPVVDYVIGSEYGEESLELLVRHELGENVSLESIPHLTWRNGSIRGFDYETGKATLSILSSKLSEGRNRNNVLDAFPIVDRTLYPREHWEAYRRNYSEKFAGLHKVPITGVSTMNRARGCSRARDNTKCKFCDMWLDPVSSSPIMFWKEGIAAFEQVGANVLYEVCDSFSSFGKFLRGVAKARPSNLRFEPQFFVYAQAVDLVRDPEIVKYFKDIGVFRVNIGLESFSNPTLKHMKGENDSVDKNYRALRMLKEAGIYVYGSLVLGSEAETQQTLRETVEGVRKIIEEGLVADIEAQPVLPLPNNVYGRRLHEAGLFPGGEEADWPINTDEVSRIYIDNFSGISHRQAIEATREIRGCAKKGGINFGSGVSRGDQYA